MTIQSYLVYAEPGRLQSVAEALRSLSECEITPALNQDLLVLVTESSNDSEQKALERRLEQVEGITCLAMVGGWAE
ncbi:MAG: chaperone NapD [Bryobacterales bacterium]|nr:chaperone NapD [Bryobacterales bacterium]